eukprot:gb/GECH01004698.1/.p1 GENE.gb/GECH01004698.1/~~gb/GECH01004698.1/.p1  ORF type:complete len:189 (+),score=27.56 gb/GECH01004698.1/:1-567(+)
MLFFFLRYIWTIFWAYMKRVFGTTITDLNASYKITRIVLPDQIDFNLHMNNMHYFNYMEHARTDMGIRSGFLDNLISSKLQPVLAGVSYQFRRELRPFQLFQVHSKILGIEGRWMYFDHQFTSNGKWIGHGIARLAFTDKKGSVPAQEVVERLVDEKTAAEWSARGVPEITKKFDSHQEDLKEPRKVD